MESEIATYLVGLGKREMTCFLPGVGMMGYGQHHNLVKEIATPLWARAMVIKHALTPFIWIHLEQAFVTIALKQEIVKRLSMPYGVEERHVLITAQHTHSAPGGYSHYPLYNFTIPGFQKQVFEKVCSSSVEAVELAFQTLTAATMDWGDVNIPANQDVAFNRSMKPYLNNEDALDLREEDRPLGVNRRMTGLNIKNASGSLIAHLNWFGVHCTSVSSFNQRIHHDNKGVAAELFEKHHPGATAFFLQSTAGDVSPNFIWDKHLKRMVGKYPDQYDSAAFNGEIQFRFSEKLETYSPLEGAVECYETYFDMSLVAAPPAHGLGFLKGTLEGPGVSATLAVALKLVAKFSRTLGLMQNPQDREFYEAHGQKEILLDHRSGDFLGISLESWKKLPLIPEPTIRAFQQAAKAQSINTLPWVPQVIPFQLIRLGQLLVVGLPGEITTMAGQRLRDALSVHTVLLGIKEVQITTYANGYMGYITTPEEYDLQAYEGGHTIYGRKTLEAVMTACLLLVEQMKHSSPQKSSTPAFQFPPEELERRSI